MRKIIVLFFIISINSQAQIGINTTNPKAQLDIRSSNQAAPSNTDGILIPKIDAFPATNPTAAQQGMLVYLTTTSGSNLPGFYYWDNTTIDWKPIIGNNLGTLDQAYDYGGSGNGKTITADAGAVIINGTDGLVSTGTVGSGAIAPSGAGSRMVWNPNKSAFRAGTVTTNQWDDINIGSYSVAFGNQTIASGSYASAFGFLSLASGPNATAFGLGTNSASGNTFAAGFNTDANGYLSTVFGDSNTASSYGETVFGIGATTYTPSASGNLNFQIANASDRLFVIGNAIDTNANFFVENSERRDAMVVLKNGNVGFGSSIPTERLHIVGKFRMVDGNQALGKVLTSDANGTASWQNASANAWGLVGNAGTDPTSNFIGTTDNIDLVFRRGNIISGKLGDTNTFFGRNSGVVNTGSSNTFIGERTGIANISGGSNTFVGRLAGANGSIGNSNTYLGYAAGLNNTGNSNLILGSFASQNTTGNFNVFVGPSAGTNNTTGTRNTTIGFQSEVGASNLTNATAIGTHAQVDASNSLVLGCINGVNGSLASTNVGIGITSPITKLHLADNSASTTVGQLYLEQQGTGDALIHIGNTGSRHFNLGLNTFTDSFKIGTSPTAATSATTNTLMTIQATGEVGIGTTTPSQKLHVSGPAGLTAIRIANTSGTGITSNVALDFFRNTAINTDWRIYNIGANLTVGNSGDDLATVNDLYQFQGIRFMPMNDGTQSLGQAANRWNTLFATNGTINTSDRREKKEIQPLNYGLNQLMQLKPVTFKWNNSQIDNNSKHLGFIAQDLQEVLPEVVVDSEWMEDGKNKVWKKTPLLGVNYAEIIPVLVQSIQEQQVIIEAQKKEIEYQKTTLEIILKRLTVLEKNN